MAKMPWDKADKPGDKFDDLRNEMNSAKRGRSAYKGHLTRKKKGLSPDHKNMVKGMSKKAMC